MTIDVDAWFKDQNISIRDIINAMKKDGYKKAVGVYIDYTSYDGYAETETKVNAACAFGQAALNLAPEDWPVEYKADLAGVLHENFNLAYNDNQTHAEVDIILLNDTTDMTVAQIAEEIERQLNAKV
jgi:hypothetical protein